ASRLPACIHQHPQAGCPRAAQPGRLCSNLSEEAAADKEGPCKQQHQFPTQLSLAEKGDKSAGARSPIHPVTRSNALISPASAALRNLAFSDPNFFIAI